jgi:hypothetical protein
VNRIHIARSTKPPLTDILHVYAFVCVSELYSKYFLSRQRVLRCTKPTLMYVCMYVCRYTFMYAHTVRMYVYILLRIFC